MNVVRLNVRGGAGDLIRQMVRLARPDHWVKNLIVLFPVVFALRMGDPTAWFWAVAATAAFCLASSVAYIINDLHDRQRDRLHPFKKDRPLASGKISPGAALAEALVLAAVSVAIAAAVNLPVLGVTLAYLLLMLVYTFVLKHKMLLDVITLALGFVLRAAAGGLAIRVELSPWLFIVTFTLCLFMGYCKRFNEIVTLPPDSAAGHRATLAGYRPDLLTHLITLSAAVAIVAFLLYATTPRTVAHVGTHYLVYTLPLVIYGVTRLAMLSMRGTYGDPTDVALRDRPFQLTLLLWVVMAVFILLFGKQLRDHLPLG